MTPEGAASNAEDITNTASPGSPIKMLKEITTEQETVQYTELLGFNTHVVIATFYEK